MNPHTGSLHGVLGQTKPWRQRPPPSPCPVAAEPESFVPKRQSTSRLCSFTAVSPPCDLSLHNHSKKQLSPLTAHRYGTSSPPLQIPHLADQAWNPLGTPGLRTGSCPSICTWCLLMLNSELNCRRTLTSSEHPLALTSATSLGDRKQANHWFSCLKTHSFQVSTSLKSECQ